MKMLLRAAVAALCLFLAQAAAAQKTAGKMTVLGDAADFAAASSSMAASGYALDGALAGVAYSTSGAGSIGLESGFYSKLVVGMPGFDYSPGTSSYALVWAGGGNPAGTTYNLFVSTWAQADPYMVYYSTDMNGYPVETLAPNTSFYNFAVANYMEGDYSAPASTTSVTLAVAPSTGALTIADAGHNTLGLSFAGFENPPPVPDLNWTNPINLPAARYGLASVVYGTHVFISGGFDGVYVSSAVLQAPYAPDGTVGASQTIGFMPAGLYGHQMIAARGRLYILGGYSGTGSRDEVWSADISSTGALGKWEAEQSLPDRMYFHAAALIAGRIYVSGGYKSGSGVLGSSYSSAIGDDGTLGAWATLGPMPAPRYAHSMTFLPGRLIIAGGNDGASARSEVWSCPFTPGGQPNGACAAYTPLPSPRYGHMAVAVGDRIYLIGGNNGSAAQAQVFITSVPAAGSNPWEAAGSLPQPRQFAGAVAVASKLWVFGGSGGTAASDLIYSSQFRGTEYVAEIAEDAVFTSGVRSSGWSSSPRAAFGDLLPSSTYYFRAKARNWTGIETAYSPVGSTITYAAIPGTAPWTNVGVDSATVNWLPNGNPGGYNYEVLYSTSPDFGASTSVVTAATTLPVAGLSQSTTYYAKVRVNAPSVRFSRYADLPPVRTSFNPALDVASPTINSLPADFAGWKSTNTFPANFSFTDVGASGIAKFQLRVSTGSPQVVVKNWQDAVTGINQPSYNAGVPLPEVIWDAMLEGPSNYISVRVYDNSGNYTDSVSSFSVVKDSTPPSISVPYAALAPAGWQTDYPGKVTDLRFDDALSGLARVQYSVSTGKLFADGGVIPWTDIGPLNSTATLTSGDTWYQTDLTYSFNALANAASNYFSFRAVDVAGSTRTFADAFGIAKNISGPNITISTPAPAFLSTFTWVSGNTTPTNNHAVLGTEVSLLDMFSGLYYNAGGFLSGSRAWQDADDLASTFTITFNNLPLISGRQYQLVARSSDSAGDYSQLFATHTFTFDSAPPSVQILYPADGSSALSAASVSGTAADLVAGITGVEVIFQRLSDGKWWKNTNSLWESTGTPQALLAGTTPYWTWNFQPYLRDSLVNGASYYATVRATDGAFPANTGSFYSQGSTFTYVDATPPPPTATLAASTGAFSGAVDLQWRTAGDNAATGYLLSGSYKIAFSTYSGAPVSTTTAQVTLTTATLTAGATQLAVLSGYGLDPATLYYFTLWTADDAQNWSLPSNEASSVTGSPYSGSLTGRVTDASTQPVTGVLVEARAASGAVEGSDYTDTFGNYSIPGLNSLYLTIRAVWTAQDLESSVSKDSIPNGSSGVNFTLSVTYDLASISGFIPAGFTPRQAAPRPAAARYTTKEVRASSGSEPFVELYSRGRRIGAAYADPSGAFNVPNLLPGTYGLRVFNGTAYSTLETVKLLPGQNLVFTPKWELDKGKVYVYPNPANTVVNFHFERPPGFDHAEVEVFDIAGRLVSKLESFSADTLVGGSKITWDLRSENVASGVYLYILRVRDSATGTTEKAIKKFAVIR